MASAAMADHIGIYSDATGSTCTLTPGFSSTATVIHKFNAGATSLLFGISAANAPGTIIFSAPTSNVLCVVDPCPYVYNGCQSGSIILGTITALYGSTGYIEVVGAGNYPTGNYPVPLVVDCNQQSHAATGGRAYIGTAPGPCDPPLPTEPSTWGSVKSLYR